MAKSPKKKPSPSAKKLLPGKRTLRGPLKVREDMAQAGFRVMMEATGQAEKTPDPDAGKDPAAVLLGAKGGKARAKTMSKKARTASAKKAAAARWGKG